MRASEIAGVPRDTPEDRKRLLLTMLAIVAGLWIVKLAAELASLPLVFDDSYMFHRYATHVREGLGIAWNPDGAQTYGLTSLLWLAVVLPFTFLPMAAGDLLRVASSVTGLAALALTALAVQRNAGSTALKDPRVAVAAVAVPLLMQPDFIFQLSTGMDTMLSMLANASLILVTLRYVASPSIERAVVVGMAAFAAILARPDNGLVAIGFPALVFAGQTLSARVKTPRWADLALLTGLPLALFALQLTVCAVVFGTPLPLSFYAKSLNTYAEFENTESALSYLLLGLACAVPYIAILIVTRRRERWMLNLAFLLPVLATVLYLLTVKQVMGWSGRYYMPFLPYIVVPALLSLDAALDAAPRMGGPAETVLAWSRIRATVMAVPLMIIALIMASQPLETVLAHWAGKRMPDEIKTTGDLGQLPWFKMIARFTDTVVRPLPRHATIAASEIGYLGNAAPGVNVIDLVGLNDTRIATKGFSMDDLLARRPDLIWFPDVTYIGLRKAMLGDPRLARDYIVYRDVFNYGIAIRRDGPNRAMLDANVAKAWADLYPGKRLADYRVGGS